MSYIYKSITGRTVNIKDYTISDNGLEFDSPVQALDDYLGILLSRFDNGVEKLVDPENVISYIGQFANLSALQAAHPTAQQLSVAILNTDPVTVYEYITDAWVQRSSGLYTPGGPLTKDSVGLGQVDNTADVDKPVSTLQAAAIAAKYTKPVGGIPADDLSRDIADVLPSIGTEGTEIGPYIYIPSNSYRFEKLLSTNNATLDGAADDSAAFQAALDALPSGRWNDIRIPEGVASVKFNSGISLDVSKTMLHFMGATMDFTGMTAGQALTLTGTGVVTTYGQVMGGLDRAFISGPGRTSAVDGVLFTGSNIATPNVGSARSMVSNCWIRNWRKAVTWKHRGYLSTLFNCEVGSSLVGLYSAANSYDAYENVGVVRGVIGNNDVNVYLEDGLMTLTSVSLDYANYVQVAARVGYLQLDSCHVEYTLKANTYGTAGGIYSGNAPLTAFDLQPGGTSALRSDIGLATTSASALQNWVAIKMNGGLWAPTAPRSGTNANTLLVHVNQAGNALFTTCGRPKYQFAGYGTGSGYVCHNLATYNTLSSTYTSPTDWDPGFWDGSSEIPNQIVDDVSGFTTNGTKGLSISPAHNLLGSYGISGTSAVYSFENDGEYSENCTIVEDSAGTTTAILPTNRLNGQAGTVSSNSSFSHSGTKSLKITKTGLAGQPFKVAIDVPIPNGTMHRQVFRGVLGEPTTTGATTGSVVVNLAWIRDNMARISDSGTIYNMTSNSYFVSGSPATSGSAAAPHSASVFKASSGSLYTDLTTHTLNTWYAFQLTSSPDLYRPGWATTLRVELDLKNMGPGEICFDSLDLQNL